MQADGGLNVYLKALRRFPKLEPPEEVRLARRWYEHRDRSAAEKLVSSHLRLVTFIARRYRGYGLPVSDLISEGNVGLMRALDRFEPDRGTRFSTYASWWIKASIDGYVVRSRSMVNLITTPHRRRLFYKLNETKSKVGSFHRDLSSEQIKAIARLLRVPEQDVVDMNGWLTGDASLNAPFSAVAGKSGEWQELLIDEREDPETSLASRQETRMRRRLVMSALSVLKERDRRIFEARWLTEDPLTLQQLAEEFGISRERVRQIETESFNKVQAEIESRLGDDALG